MKCCRRFLLCVLPLVAMCACVSEKQSPKPPRATSYSGAPIEEINLLAVPVALNFDQALGPDGFIVKVYASTRRDPKPVPIEAGKIELFMFDASAAEQSGSPPVPRRTWTFSAQDLKAFEIHTSIGTGYQLVPLWGEAKPSGGKISVVVRFTSSSGEMVTSAPSIISVAAR